MTADELAAQMHPSPHRSSVAARLAQIGPERENLVYPFGVRVNGNGRPVQIWHMKYGPRSVTVATGEYL